MTLRMSARTVLVAVIAALAGPPTVARAGDDGTAAPPYRVENGNVDARTFVGWRVYHETCVTCHGADGVTTGAAPSLLDAIGGYTATGFAMKVRSRYLVPLSGEDAGSESGSGVREAFIAELQRHEAASSAGPRMPSWEDHPLVHDRINAVYAYLKARADGALGPGKPGLIRATGN
jgi:mono/diheme cytochrome c family protein